MIRLPACDECIHFYDEEDKMTCKAYPEGIPQKILFESGKNAWDGKCSERYVFTKKSDTTSQ